MRPIVIVFEKRQGNFVRYSPIAIGYFTLVATLGLGALKMKLSAQFCPILSDAIDVAFNETPIAQIDRFPLNSYALPLDTLADPKGWGSEPLYLDNFGDSICAYPIHYDNSVPATKSLSHEIFAPKDRNGKHLYGTPTSLNTVPIRGSIYDPSFGLFFVQDIHGPYWYLVGDHDNYALFTSGIARFASQLEVSLFNFVDPPSHWHDIPETYYHQEKDMPRYSEAQESIDRFLAWLEEFDSALYRDIYTGLDYSENYPESPEFKCASPYLESLYAYFDPLTDTIHLMPIAIEMLQQGEYEGVAQILAHERAHRFSAMNRLAVPSDQMLEHSLLTLMDSLIEQRRFPSNALEGLFHFLRGKAYCEYLPLLPEEEIQAFHQELDYSEQNLLPTNTHHLRAEAIEYTDFLKKIVSDQFPEEWSWLSAQYIELALAHKSTEHR